MVQPTDSSGFDKSDNALTLGDFNQLSIIQILIPVLKTENIFYVLFFQIF